MSAAGETASTASSTTATSGFRYSQISVPPEVGNIKVHIRIRPPDSENKTGEPPCLRQLADGRLTHFHHDRDHTFSFDSVLDERCSQQDVFKTIGIPIVDNVLQGYNVCCIAYGQTGSGKTYTLLGPMHSSRTTTPAGSVAASPRSRPLDSPKPLGRSPLSPALSAVTTLAAAVSGGGTPTSVATPSTRAAPGASVKAPGARHQSDGDSGLSARVFAALFAGIERDRAASAAAAAGGASVRYTCAASFVQIYSEKLSDLLVPGKDGLPIRQTAQGGVFVEGISEHKIDSGLDAVELLSRGAANRRVNATNMNFLSSRSHAVFSLRVQRQEAGLDGRKKYWQSELHLVDLAGTERLHGTGAAGAALAETCDINLSLSTLGRVVRKIVKVQRQRTNRHQHIPYRDSKLTYLLKDSLGGSARTVIIANVAPDRTHAFETLQTLKFAHRVSAVQNAVSVRIHAEHAEPETEEHYTDDLYRENRLLMAERDRLRIELEARDAQLVEVHNQLRARPFGRTGSIEEDRSVFSSMGGTSTRLPTEVDASRTPQPLSMTEVGLDSEYMDSSVSGLHHQATARSVLSATASPSMTPAATTPNPPGGFRPAAGGLEDIVNRLHKAELRANEAEAVAAGFRAVLDAHAQYLQALQSNAEAERKSRMAMAQQLEAMEVGLRSQAERHTAELAQLRVEQTSGRSAGEAGGLLDAAAPEDTQVASATMENLRLLDPVLEPREATRLQEITRIHISFVFLGQRGARFLGGLLHRLPQLQELWLAWTGLGDKGAALLARALPAARLLRRLGLDHNRITSKGAAHLARALPTCVSLQELWLRMNEVRDDGAVALANVLPRLPALWKLVLDSNEVTDGGAAALLAAPRGDALGEVWLYGNPLSFNMMVAARRDRVLRL